MDSFYSSRRFFLRAGALALFGLGRFARGVVDVAKNMVSPTDPTANVLKYNPKAKAVPAVVRKDSKQFCHTCVQYQDQKKEKWNGEEVAPCLIFSGKYVSSQGWCSVWAGPKKT